MRSFIAFFRFYYRLCGIHLLILPLILLAGVAMDALGISILIPVLEGFDPESRFGKVISSFFSFLGISFSLGNFLILGVLLFSLRALAQFGRDVFLVRLTMKLSVKEQIKVARRFFHSRYRFFLGQDTGHLNNAITQEIPRAAGSFKSFGMILASIIQSSIFVGIPLIVTPWLALGVILTGILLLPLIRYLNSRVRRCSMAVTVHKGKMQTFIIQMMHHFKYLKATHGQDRLLEKVQDESIGLGRESCRLSILNSIGQFGLQPLVLLPVVGLFYYEVEILHRSIPEVGGLLYLLKRGLDELLWVQSNYRHLLGCYGSIDVYHRLERDLDREDEDLERTGKAPVFDQDMIWDHLSFAYDTGSDVIRDLSFRIRPRTTVAFVGPSGAGKSTLVTLLTGILQPTSGQIRMGEIDCAEMDQRQWRTGIGYVTQESVIFNDTIRNNITMWKEGVPDKAVREAARRAHIRDFVEGLPRGYDTLVGDNGVRLSGGQRQRICIARELMKQPNILIFDEATSSLDTESEREIQRNIDDFHGEKTVVIIAHRLSTVRNADVIYVLRDGVIVEQGSWDELKEKPGGAFAKMLAMQENTLPGEICSSSGDV